MKDLLLQIKQLKVLVIGDVMLDRYVIGEVNRISPEAPVPVISVNQEKTVAGGAANVALNAASLGATVEVCGWFGKDSPGEKLKRILESKNIFVDESFSFSDAPTICKTRVMSSNQQICRVDREDNPKSYEPNILKLNEKFTEKVKSSDLIIISDYGKGFVTNELISIVREHSSFMSIDPKPSRLLDYCNPNLLTPNRHEAMELAGLSRLSKGDFCENNIIDKIFKRFGPEKLAITMGSEGMVLAENGKVNTTIPTSAKEVYDVSGAGDTVIAVLSMALVAGGGFEQSARLANIAAGLVVGKVGTAVVTVPEIIELI